MDSAQWDETMVAHSVRTAAASTDASEAGLPEDEAGLPSGSPALDRMISRALRGGPYLRSSKPDCSFMKRRRRPTAKSV